MRPIPFKGVYEAIVSRMGLDPASPVPHNLYQAIPRNLNKELRTGWTYWEWPYIELCDERAFQRIWNDYEQFAASEKVIFIRNMLYYQAKPGASGASGPPIGALPTDPLHWDPLPDYGNLILFDQICRRPMGLVIGVYPSDPRVKNSSCHCGLDYRPAGNGIEVLGGHGPSVFVKYQLPVPEFTLTPYAPGRNYSTGNNLYHATSGECYLAVANSNDIEPPFPAKWLKIDFPDFLEDYVVAATYADCIKEMSQASVEDPEQQKMRLVLSKDAKEEAEEALVGVIDELRAMGQRYSYCAWRRPSYSSRPPPGVCLSEPFDPTGGTLPPELQPPVTTLSEICESSYGYIPSGPPGPPGPPGQRGSYWFLGTGPPPAVVRIPATEVTPEIVLVPKEAVRVAPVEGPPPVATTHGQEGPPGEAGRRATMWTTGVSDPQEVLHGDLYLNKANGDVWQFNADTGTWRKI